MRADSDEFAAEGWRFLSGGGEGGGSAQGEGPLAALAGAYKSLEAFTAVAQALQGGLGVRAGTVQRLWEAVAALLHLGQVRRIPRPSSSMRDRDSACVLIVTLPRSLSSNQ